MNKNCAPIDIYFHMANHYKKLKSVKSVVDTSSPAVYCKLSQNTRQSRPSSRTANTTPSTSKLASSNNYNRGKSGKCYDICSSSNRSQSVPVRMPTQGKIPDMPRQKQCTTPAQSNSSSKKCNSACNSQSPKSPVILTKSPKLIAVKENDALNMVIKQCAKPTPAPRHNKSGNTLNKKNIPQYEYLRFSLRITEDIIRNDLFTNKEMKRAFNSHIEANRGRLDIKKMQEQIENLCEELNIVIKDDEDDCIVVRPQKRIISQFTHCATNGLNCECGNLQNSPLIQVFDTTKKQQSNEDNFIETYYTEKPGNSLEAESMPQFLYELYYTKDCDLEVKPSVEQIILPNLSHLVKIAKTDESEYTLSKTFTSDTSTKLDAEIVNDEDLVNEKSAISNSLSDQIPSNSNIIEQEEECLSQELEKQNVLIADIIKPALITDQECSNKLIDSITSAMPESTALLIETAPKEYEETKNDASAIDSYLNDFEAFKLNTLNRLCVYSNESNHNQCDNLKENSDVQCEPSKLEEEYVLIQGPVYIPKACFKIHNIQRFPEKTFVDKNTSTFLINSTNKVKKAQDDDNQNKHSKAADVYRYMSTGSYRNSLINSDQSLILTYPYQNLITESNDYDLTPQRDSNISTQMPGVTNIDKENLLLGDEYTISNDSISLLSTTNFNKNLSSSVKSYTNVATQTQLIQPILSPNAKIQNYSDTSQKDNYLLNILDRESRKNSVEKEYLETLLQQSYINKHNTEDTACDKEHMLENSEENQTLKSPAFSKDDDKGSIDTDSEDVLKVLDEIPSTEMRNSMLLTIKQVTNNLQKFRITDIPIEQRAQKIIVNGRNNKKPDETETEIEQHVTLNSKAHTEPLRSSDSEQQKITCCGLRKVKANKQTGIIASSITDDQLNVVDMNRSTGRAMNYGEGRKSLRFDSSRLSRFAMDNNTDGTIYRQKNSINVDADKEVTFNIDKPVDSDQKSIVEILPRQMRYLSNESIQNLSNSEIA